MWLKRASKNRRLGREFVLDVKLRSSQVRAARARTVALALGALFASCAGVYLVWRSAEFALNVLLYENKAFSIQEINVQTDGVIAPDQLRRWSGVRPGQNLFALDLARVRRDLEMVSMVQSVSLEKVLPHTLRIRVVEREPVAQLSIPRPRANGGFEMALYYLDVEGYVMLPLDGVQFASPANQANDQLPLIRGPTANEVQPGRRLESPQVHAALELIVAFERSPMEGLAYLKRIDAASPDVLTAITVQGSEITFGLADLDQQLRRWHRVYKAGQDRKKAIATLDLAVTNNIPASWLEASALPSTPIRSARPSRDKKKHV